MAAVAKPTSAEPALPKTIPHWRLIIDQSRITQDVLVHNYEGAGTDTNPFIVTWIPQDPGDPQNFRPATKWLIVLIDAFAMLATTFDSSALSGAIREVIDVFNASSEVAILGVSLFVLGFAVGPLLWAPMSEIYGRQIMFIMSFGGFTIFSAAAVGAKNIQTLLVLRFFAGSFGSAPLTNSGGQLADMFGPSQRGLAMPLIAVAPFLGPTIGPIAGGFLAESKGWKWVAAMMAIFPGIMWIVGVLFIPETYAPVLLRNRSHTLSKMTGQVYRTKEDSGDNMRSRGYKAVSTALTRPWILLFKEPIVSVLSIYMSIIYGTLYMLFGAYPICFQEVRGWSEGIGALPFLGVAIGTISASLIAPLTQKTYMRAAAANGGFAHPEARLVPAMTGAIAIPIGLFWFAWTNSPSIHWISSVIAGVPFGFGMVIVFIAIFNYLIDTYTVFAASALAANSVLRSLFGFAFPLFTRYMFDNIGIHWGASIPAFLALVCVPAPFVFTNTEQRFEHAVSTPPGQRRL